MCRYYVLDDGPKKFGGAKKVHYLELAGYNKKGYGCFFTPNDFEGDRKVENLKKINFWIADIDDGTKEEQMDRIEKLILKPSTIVETKKGYHCYWRADGATIENYRNIELGLIKVLNADKHCKDPSRLLRVPGFYHMKDRNNPFMVNVVYSDDRTFTEKQMLFCYKLPEIKYKKIEYKGEKEDLIKEENWNKIFKIDRIGVGCRNGELSRIAFWLRDEGFPQQIVLNTILRMNQKIYEPLPEWEVRLLVNSKF